MFHEPASSVVSHMRPAIKAGLTLLAEAVKLFMKHALTGK